MTENNPPRRLWRTLRSIILNLLIILAAILALDWYRAPDSVAIANLPALTSSDGKTFHLDDNRPTLLYIWGDWCIYCRHTSPAIDRLARDGYRVVSIALKSGDDAHIAAYLREHGWQFPVVNDADGRISAALHVRATPTIAIIKNGRLRLSTSGWTSATGLKLRLWWAEISG